MAEAPRTGLERLQDAPPDMPGPRAEPGVFLLPVFGPLLGAGDEVVALLHDADAVGHHRLGTEELLLVVDEVPPLEPPVEVVLVVVDALPHRLRPVRVPHLHADVAGRADLGILELPRQIFFERHRRRLSHPDEHDAVALRGGIALGPHLRRQGGVDGLDQPGHALPRLVEHVAVVGAGDRALEIAQAVGEPRAAVRAPVGQRDHLALLAAEEHELLAEHLQADRPLAADLLGLDARIPVLAEAEPRAEVERPDLRGALRLFLDRGLAALFLLFRLVKRLEHGRTLLRPERS